MSINSNLISQHDIQNGPEFEPGEDMEQPVAVVRASLRDRILETIRKTHEYYRGDQYDEGYWWYELESNVTIISEYLMLLRFLGIRDHDRERKIANHILRNQGAEGSWSLYRGGRGDLSTTIEAYFALKLAGYSSDDPRLKKARHFILREGGVEQARVFTKVYLALFGQFDWKSIPSLPVEINLLPAWFPLNIYNCSSWARSTVVPLSVVLAFKPVRTIPDQTWVRELYKNPDRLPPIATRQLSLLSWKRIFFVLDTIIKTFEMLPVRRPFMQKALRKTEQWILDHQEECGDWGGIQPAMINSILALVTIGYSVESVQVQRGLAALERFLIDQNDELSLQSCISPVWDTALTSLALLASGMDKSDPGLINSGTWLASKQIFRKGDWSIKRPDVEPGGWAFEFENSWYPDVDDTAVVLMFLANYSESSFANPEKLEKGLRWVLGMQGKDGGWGAFDVNNNMRLLNHVPFGDLEAMIDPSTADLTGRVLELLGKFQFPISDARVQRAIAFLKKEQEENGSWWGRWGVNFIYGTCTVLMGLHAIGENMATPYVREAVEWLKFHQNPDGGWGEGCESYDETEIIGQYTESTASQTAWAILGLIAAGEQKSPEVLRGIRFLLNHQKHDGTWDEESFTGTGFPKFFFIRYHNYRNCFPLMALGKFLSSVQE